MTPDPLILDGYLVQTGDVTVANLDIHVASRRYSAVTSTKRCPEDRNNPEAGTLIATARALRRMADRMERQANGLIHNDNQGRAARKSRQSKMQARFDPALAETLGDHQVQIQARCKPIVTDCGVSF